MIPKMTHELSRHWEQPDRSEILLDDEHALMSVETFDKLHAYNCSTPTGVYKGKMWRSKYGVGWLLWWFGYSENPEACSRNYRKIIVVR